MNSRNVKSWKREERARKKFEPDSSHTDAIAGGEQSEKKGVLRRSFQSAGPQAMLSVGGWGRHGRARRKRPLSPREKTFMLGEKKAMGGGIGTGGKANDGGTFTRRLS